MSVVISKTKMKKRDPLEVMRFLFCSDRESFISFFNKLGIPIKTEDDLVILARWHNEGVAEAGKLVNVKGEMVKINILDAIGNIKLRHNNVLNCGIKFVD